jgi:predicted Zn-dependent protease
MSGLSDIAERVLAHVDSGAEAEVTITQGHEALTRFANSYIHQNVAEDGALVNLKVVMDGRVASSTTDRMGAESLERLAAQTMEAARLQPVDQDWPGLTPPREVPPLEHWDQGTAEASPADRARLVKEFVGAGKGFEAAGYCQTTATSVVFANSAGHLTEDRFTNATLDGIHRDGAAAGSGHAASVRLADLDGESVGGLAFRRAKASLGAVDVKAGDYEVVLAQECVATIGMFMAFYGFNAKSHLEGQSFVKLGEQQFDPGFRLIDDATAKEGLHVGFDSEGSRKGPLVLIDGGVSSALAHDRRTARKAGTETTGHALDFFGGYFGPIPTDLVVAPGPLSEDELVSSVDQGLYVSTFNYCRVLDPKTLVVTGLTRNGTFLIENGRVTTPVTNLRFTQSFVVALAPGQLKGVGSDERHADSEFGAGFVHCPSLHLGSWHFTGGALG